MDVMEKGKILAIIPAKLKSERLECKNINPFFGIPILAYSIKACVESLYFDEVMVSTDSGVIVKIAKDFGANVPFMRSANNSDNQSTLADVVLEVLEEYKKIGKTFKYVCCVLPTAPLISKEKLRDGAQKLITNHTVDAVIAITQFTSPIQRALRKNKGFVEMINPENYFKRSQDMETTYHDSGQFYWLRVDSFLKEKKFFMPKTKFIEIPESEAQDIDTQEDWELAELKFFSMLRKKKRFIEKRRQE